MYRLYAHPLFVAQLKALKAEVERLKAKDPQGYLKKNASKRLAAITHLIFEVIPQDPTRPEYRQGHTLGAAYSHWFRVKFFSQYRLFFRFDQVARIIVYAWVNDENSLRAYGSPTDAYRVFSNRLSSGTPPDSWATLLKHGHGLPPKARAFAAPPAHAAECVQGGPMTNRRTTDVRTVQQGRPFTVTLEELASAGYLWTLPPPQAFTVQETQEAPIQPAGHVGGPSQRTFTLTPRTPGSFHLTFVYARPWETGAPAATHDLAVSVLPAPNTASG
ncbi:type II toxin-antitoxin system YhaV family toxin [Deinococcus sp. KNUC1210]|uniref:type II toxin-antitoxin system YhaV family toxin n=1 Tax=Deinococcus sp. KNUC1210 TaxID=2917691 RepID=UPI001EF103A2|nr:type II toxin-antitoxin system YhaV family toxin [Deinococcus sp. KNUC1210]ULH15514.1 type II toxin-antitoxin system YhaV family toxin [Deinococcus sp. KNUC1210]